MANAAAELNFRSASIPNTASASLLTSTSERNCPYFSPFNSGTPLAGFVAMSFQ
jgi:hypothetical protein